VEKVFKSVGLVARYDKKQALKLVEELAEYLKDKNLKVYIEDTLAGKVNVQEAIPLAKMKTDFIVTIGGDGTILRTCVTIPKPEPPILAINMGVRGFLTEVQPKEACAAVEKCLKGEFKIEKCAKLAVSTAGECAIPDALNDIVISAGEPSKILYTQILKDKKPLLKCQADGLIVSTQTGSTGYSLSAGGPVLDPEVDAFVLTPICSLTVFRSLVFPANSKVTIQAIRPKCMLVLVDGNYRQLVKSKKPALTVTRSKNVTSFIRFKDDFYHRLRSRVLFKGMG
jgi:NAD+ kinase